MEELDDKLHTWGQEGINRTAFIVVYSGIGVGQRLP